MTDPTRGLTRSRSIDGALRLRAREMRRNPTPSEAAAWRLVRRRDLYGLRFRRQQIIDRFIVDLYCHSLRLCLEIDGDVHDPQPHQEADAVRDERLAALGYRVVRIRAENVARDALERLLLPFVPRAGDLIESPQRRPRRSR